MNLQNKTIVVSVIYPAVEPYINEFLNSLASQTNSEFTLLIINDGYARIKKKIDKYDLSYKLVNFSGTPAVLRKKGINWALNEGFDFIVFADSDDYFEPNRIDVAKRRLVDSDIIVNELVLVGEQIKTGIPMLSKKFYEGEIFGLESILEKNIMGLSNTSIRTSVIPPKMQFIPDDIIAFDWALFSLILQNGFKAKFTNFTKTYYRQHNMNLASPLAMSDEQILRGVEVKRSHYAFMSKWHKQYLKLYSLFNELSTLLQNNKHQKQRYLKAIRENSPNSTLWWENIRPMEEVCRSKLGNI